MFARLAFSLPLIASWCLCSAQSPRTLLPISNGRKWAIVVGVSQYTHLSKLEYSSNDAEHFASTLEKSCEFDPNDVTLLADNVPHATTPTAANILGAITDRIDHGDLDKNDLFVFFFSGHGVEIDGKDYLLPADARHETIETDGLNIQDVIDQMRKAHLRNAILVVDACRETPNNTFGAETLRIAKQSRIAVLLSCKPGEQSYEEPDLESGLFTSSLINLLQGSSCVDTATGALWTSDLIAPLDSTVSSIAKKYGVDQDPTALLNDGQDIVLTVKSATATNTTAFLKRNQTLSPDQQVANVLSLSQTQFAKGDYDDACHTLASVEQLAIKDPKFAYEYASAALQLNQQTTYFKVCKIVNDLEPCYYTDMLRLMVDAPIVFEANYEPSAKRMLKMFGFPAWVGMVATSSYDTAFKIRILRESELDWPRPEARCGLPPPK